eukprot:TRINITY_DN9316_c1_g1_i1.p1 TRINITY_DN9316_c1_g1~~TRINITY_DN9316_c1_g1_i1.p1  ORF type:complete len:527 (+),score=81.84 TRINITY_DN9316_c1_g1_i1:163-1743(+)
MEFDLFLLIMIVAVIGFAVAVNVKVLLYYQETEGSRFARSIFCKVIIVVSMTLAWVVNLLLPIDVRNSRGGSGMLDMVTFWVATFITLAVFAVLVVPGAMFYHEVEGDDLVKRKRNHVLCNLGLTVFFSVCAIAISYPFLANASLPVTEYSCGDGFWLDDDAAPATNALPACSQSESSVIKIKVSFDIYIIACLCFIGWFFLVVFGGIGLSAVPLELIIAFIDRPSPISEGKYKQHRQLLGKAARLLLSRAEELQAVDTEVSAKTGWRSRGPKRKLRNDYNEWKRDVHTLEDQNEALKVAKFHRGENPAVSIMKLFLGIFCAILSFLWILHILLYIVSKQLTPDNKPVTIFLNALLSVLESTGFYPIPVSVFAVFTLYLLLCVVRGCLKFGMRVFFLFSIHPMRRQSTPLNSILFNVEMVLISSAAVVQFAQQAFADYARLTDADVIFAAQIKYMSFYRFFFQNNIFIYLLLAWFLVSLIYLLVRPRDTPIVQLDNKGTQSLQKMVSAALSTSSGSAGPAAVGARA